MTLRTGCSRGRTPKVVRPQQRKNPLPFPISQRSHVGNLRQTLQGKGEIHKRVETAGVYPLVRPRGVSALPAEVQRKTPRPDRVNRLRGSSAPAQPVLKRLPPGKGEHACGSSCPPAGRCRKYIQKRAAAPMQQLFSMQKLNRTASKPKFPRRYARSPR